MIEASDEIVTSMDMRISYLAIIGTLGPMIGLVGTIWGMIMSFKEIAMAAGAQPRPDQVAEGISTALVHHPGRRVALGSGDLLLRILPQSHRPDDHGSDPGRRSDHQFPGCRGQVRQDRLTPIAPGGDAMAAIDEHRAQSRAQFDATARRRLSVDHVLHAGHEFQQRELRPARPSARSPARPDPSRMRPTSRIDWS